MTRKEAEICAQEFMTEVLNSVVRQCPCGEWFFNVNRKWKYCSVACIEEGKRRSKRKWWNENRAKQ